MDTFAKDSKDKVPKKVFKYMNMVEQDQNSGVNHYQIKVWFNTDNGKKYMYYFMMPEGASSGTFTVKEIAQ